MKILQGIQGTAIAFGSYLLSAVLVGSAVLSAAEGVHKYLKDGDETYDDVKDEEA